MIGTIDSIIHGLETRKITEFHARFDFRKLYSLLNVYRCYSECTFLCLEDEGFGLNTPRLKLAKEIARKILSGQAQTKFTWHW